MFNLHADVSITSASTLIMRGMGTQASCEVLRFENSNLSSQSIRTKFRQNFELTNRFHFAVVCSVIDTRYDVKRGKNKKVAHASDHLNDHYFHSGMFNM